MRALYDVTEEIQSLVLNVSFVDATKLADVHSLKKVSINEFSTRSNTNIKLISYPIIDHTFFCLN